MYMPYENRPKCDFVYCFYGMGLAGDGICPGLWWHPSCPQFEDEEEALIQWEAEGIRQYDEERYD